MNEVTTNQTSINGSSQLEAKQKSAEPLKLATVNTVTEIPESEEVEIKTEDLEKAVSRLNEHAQATQRDLQFSMDEETGKTVITVLDRKTSEVIRQLPNDVTLNLAKQLNEGEPIRLFSAQA